MAAKMFASFRFHDGYLEFHLGSSRKDVENFEALSSKVEADCDEVAEWFLFSLEQMRIFDMKLVAVEGVSACMDFVRERRIS